MIFIPEGDARDTSRRGAQIPVNMRIQTVSLNNQEFIFSELC